PTREPEERAMATKSSKSNKSAQKSPTKASATGPSKAASSSAATTATGFKPGTFSWVELTTRAAAGAKRFYGELFGRTAQEMPMPGGATYAMMQLGGKDVGGLFQDAQIPPKWLSSLSVKDAEAT